jgi:hypothetical protein
LDTCESVRSVECGVCDGSDFCIENTCEACALPVCPTDGTACGTVRNACGEAVCENDCTGDNLCIENVFKPPFLAPDGLMPGDRFGEEIQAWADLVAVGAPGAETVWVFQRNDWGWNQFQTLEAPRPGEGFGDRIALNDDTLVVATDQQLVAYRRNMGGQFQLASEEPVTGIVRDISLDGEGQLFVGFEDTGGPTLFGGECGPAGCSLGQSWQPEPSDPGMFGLGYAIDSTSSFSLVSAPFDDVNPSIDPEVAGSVFFVSEVNDSGTWPRTEWPDGPTYFRSFTYLRIPGDSFAEGMGYSVALSENGLAAAGAPRDFPSFAFNDSGTVYLFGRTSSSRWSRGTRIASPEAELFSRCGHAVAIVGESAVASCMLDGRREDGLGATEERQTAGSLYWWDWEEAFAQWTIRIGSVKLPNSITYDHFGWALDGTPDELYAGAPGRNDDAGEVWIYPEP